MMYEHDGREGYAEETVSAFIGTPESATRTMTPAERERVSEAGTVFAEHVDGIWLLISGRFTSSPYDDGTEDQVKNLLRCAFDDPKHDDRTIKVLLDSSGGNLDSAYATTLYLTAYAKTVEVYVPDWAKSASTLLAIGADKIYLSTFGELGPLDSQIRDPRNPVTWVSALDCYQSVDYVRDFGLRTVREVLDRLVTATGKRIPVHDLLATASDFSLGVIDPMMQSVPALDFGGWGRNLRISEHYARKLLAARPRDSDHADVDTAHELVYGYPHHLFPIDINEARRIGLNAVRMDEKIYEEAINVVEACHKKDFVGFLSKTEVRKTGKLPMTGWAGQENHQPGGAGAELGEENLGEAIHTGNL